jgi:signal transduction histidine kinase
MCAPQNNKNRRILVIDDSRAMHDDVRRILGGRQADAAGVSQAETVLFDDTPANERADGFDIDSAYQGQQGLEMLRHALRAERPYAVAFVDIHMPPGWDGITTIAHLWQEDPNLEVVVCTAYSDYTWKQMVQTLGETDRLLILKKPFDNVEVRQLACALCVKWNLACRVRHTVDSLKKAVEERTRELQQPKEQLEKTHAQLLQARKLKTMAWCSVNIAHEINQPLTAILGHAEAGRLAAQSAEGIPDRILSDLEKIAEHAHRAGEIVRRFRALVCQSKLNRSAVDINELIRDTVHLMAPETRANGMRLQLDLSAGVPLVSADPIHVQHVISNLARNAIEAMNEDDVGVGELIVRTRKAESNTVEIAVCDTGRGVRQQSVDLLFEPFFTTKFGGMGMGLAISRSIIEAHGGRIWASPNPHRGMTFRFTLPLSAAAEQDEARQHCVCGG